MFKRGNVFGAILAGGLTAGLADFLFANVFYYVWRQIPPLKIWQFVASGLIGKPALDGGYATAALGVGLHFFITTLMAATFVLVSLRLKFLVSRPFLFGPLYGLFLYYFMNAVVLPLSNVATPPDISHLPMIGKSMEPFIGGLLIHAFGVGLPIALFARRARKD